MVKAVRIPVTVKMRAGWNEREVNAPELARRMEDAGAAGLAVHGRTAAQSYSGLADWELIASVAAAVSIPVWGNGDCNEPQELLDRMRETGVAGILVGRGVLRNPWIFAQAAALAAGQPMPVPTMADRGRFLLDYIDLLQAEPSAEPTGFRHSAPRDAVGADLRVGPPRAEFAPRNAVGADLGVGPPRAEFAPRDAVGADLRVGPPRDTRVLRATSRKPALGEVSPSDRVEGPRAAARSRDRHVINKLRALSAWYTRGFENGSHLRHTINRTESVPALRQVIGDFFGTTP